MHQVNSANCQKRNHHQTRARCALLWGVSVFVITELCLVVLFAKQPQLVDQEFGEKLALVQNYIRSQQKAPIVLMLGSSRVATGFRPAALVDEGPSTKTPLIFNFAQVGSGPEMAHLTLSRLVRSGMRPDWVLVEYWPPFWAVERYLSEYARQINLGCLTPPEVQLLSGYVNRPDKLIRAWLSHVLNPVYGNREMLRARVIPEWLLASAGSDERCHNLDMWGWWSPETSVTEAEYQKREAALYKIYAPRLNCYRVAKAPHQALVNIIALCKREGIKLAVVVLPESTRFRSWYSDDMLHGVDSYVHELERDHSVRVIDARSWVRDEGFMDGQHLLPKGATEFTKRLGDEVLYPMLAEEKRVQDRALLRK